MFITKWFCGVMVSTLDFESKDPSSSLGRTSRKKTRLVRTEVYFIAYFLNNNYLINASLEQEIQWIYIINEVKHHSYKRKKYINIIIYIK